MSPEVIAAIAAGIASIVTTIGVVVTAILSRQIKQVHTLVNSQHDATMVREEVLIAKLQESGIKIPKDESLKKE